MEWIRLADKNESPLIQELTDLSNNLSNDEEELVYTERYLSYWRDRHPPKPPEFFEEGLAQIKTLTEDISASKTRMKTIKTMFPDVYQAWVYQSSDVAGPLWQAKWLSQSKWLKTPSPYRRQRKPSLDEYEDYDEGENKDPDTDYAEVPAARGFYELEEGPGFWTGERNPRQKRLKKDEETE